MIDVLADERHRSISQAELRSPCVMTAEVVEVSGRIIGDMVS
jgi:hypothetical protein